MSKQKTKKVNMILLTAFVIVFVSVFSYLLVDGIIEMIGNSLTSTYKIIIGTLGVIVAIAIGWMKS